MRYVLFRTKGASPAAPLHVGAQTPDGGAADISAFAQDQGTALNGSMRTFLELGPAAGAALAAGALANPAYHRKAEHIELRAPIYDWSVGAARAGGAGRPRARARAARCAAAPRRAAPLDAPSPPLPPLLPPTSPPRPAARRCCAWA